MYLLGLFGSGLRLDKRDGLSLLTIEIFFTFLQEESNFRSHIFNHR